MFKTKQRCSTNRLVVYYIRIYYIITRITYVGHSYVVLKLTDSTNCFTEKRRNKVNTAAVPT